MSTTLLRLSESLFRSKIGSRDMAKSDRTEERVYKSLWHVAIAAVGIYEFRHHKSKISKVLSAGLIAFHLDGAIADALDVPPLSKRIINAIRPDEHPTEESDE